MDSDQIFQDLSKRLRAVEEQAVHARRGSSGEQLLVWQGAQIDLADAGPTDYDYICLRDEKAANTAGGTFTSGSYITRALTEFSDTGGNCTISASVFVLVAGTYRCRIKCPAFHADSHKARLRNTTGSTTLLVGTSEYCSATDNTMNSSEIVGRFTVAASQNLEVQHRCQTTAATSGLGIPNNLGEVEVYTVAEFWKE